MSSGFVTFERSLFFINNTAGNKKKNCRKLNFLEIIINLDSIKNLKYDICFFDEMMKYYSVKMLPVLKLKPKEKK